MGKKKQAGKQIGWRAGDYTLTLLAELQAYWGGNRGKLLEIAVEKFHQQTQERIARGEKAVKGS